MLAWVDGAAENIPALFLVIGFSGQALMIRTRPLRISIRVR